MAKWILIIDKDLRTRVGIARVFAQRGFIVVEAPTVTEGYECVRQRDLTCVFLAVDSPEGDGIALLNILMRTRPELPVVAITNQVIGPPAEAARALGARCFLQRPISCAAVEDLLDEITPASLPGAVPGP